VYGEGCAKTPKKHPTRTPPQSKSWKKRVKRLINGPASTLGPPEKKVQNGDVGVRKDFPTRIGRGEPGGLPGVGKRKEGSPPVSIRRITKRGLR